MLAGHQSPQGVEPAQVIDVGPDTIEDMTLSHVV